jgi:hypothetical protein
MTQPNDDTGNGGSVRTFTQTEVDKIVRDRLAREREKYADYDELKAQAAEAGKSKTAMERIEAKLDEATKRADKAERDALIRDVADELGVSVRIARKFEGKTRDELLADGRETLTDMGIEPDKSKRSKPEPTGKADEGDDGTDEDDDKPQQRGTAGKQDDADAEPQQQVERPRRERPRESLRSGAPSTPSGGREDDLDPLKLVAGIRRG